MKRMLALLMALLLAVSALPALAEAAKEKADPEQEEERIMYVNRDKLNIYAKMDRDSKVVKKLKGGDKLTIDEEFDGWFSVYYKDKKDNEKIGYVLSKYMVDKMPQKYCKHKWNDWKVTREATCAKKGERTRDCKRCGLVETEDIKRLPHEYGEWTVEEEATCAEEGLKVRKCTVCGHRDEKEIEPLPHEYGEWIVDHEATCTEEGTRHRKCQECGYIEEETIELEPHEYGKWTIKKEPTCTEEGERYRRCVLCGYRDVQVLKALPHEFGDWKTTKAATCAATGERARTCVLCNYREAQVIDKQPHEFGGWKVTKEATCAAKGRRVRTCKVCGAEQAQDIDVLPHDYQWKVTTESTDHSAGVRSKVCTRCGAVQAWESFDPQGTLRRGSRGDEVRRIQQLLADQGYLSAGGVDGSFGGGTERALIQFQTDQGLTADGVAWPQTIKRLKHEFGAWRAVTPLTRDGDGEYVRTCKDCGYEESRIVQAGASIARGKRGEDVRALQRMLNDLGFNCGTADGAYGPKMDAAFETFAAENNLDFAPGAVRPTDMDALVNRWLAALPADRSMGRGSNGSPVRLVLTVTAVETLGDVTTYEWKLINMGTERCRADALLLGFGDDHDFMGDSIVVAVDGTLLQRDGANSASGTFSVASDWGDGPQSFCAVGTSEKTSAVWLSNVRSAN